MKLRAAPDPLFRGQTSPIALHARREWFGEAAAVQPLIDRQILERESAQEPDGSWGGSVATTITVLYELTLLQRQASASMVRATEWLMEVDEPPFRCSCNDGGSYDDLFFGVTRSDRQALRKLKQTPFTAGCAGFIKSGAALYFAGRCGLSGYPRVKAACQSLELTAHVRNGRLCSGSCASNVLLGLVSLPEALHRETLRLALTSLASVQLESGKWGDAVPFYPTFFMLSQLNSPLARRQFQRALPFVERAQNADGSWGRSQKQLDTLLVLTALQAGRLLDLKGGMVERID